MKILNAIHAQGIGGVDQMFRNYTKALKILGHDVSLLISDNKNSDYGDEKIFKLKNKSQIFDVIHLFFILIKFRPQVIICHSSRVIKWMKILSKIFPIKVIGVNHGISFQKSLKSDFIININQSIHEMVVNSGFDEKKSFILQNIIDVKEKYQTRQFNFKNPKIGIYGRFEPRKGFDILLKAGAYLKEKNQEFSLKIGGFSVNNYNENKIKNIAKDLNIEENCQFVGVVKDKKAFFKDIDIFVVPSREEPFGLVILEGFENSVLTISSDTEGGKMLISDKKDGFLFKNQDHVDLAEKIEFIIKNNEKYTKITENSYKKLIKNYNFDVFCNKLSDILKKIG